MIEITSFSVIPVGPSHPSPSNAIPIPFAPTEIQVLDDDWNVVETISPETVRGLI